MCYGLGVSFPEWGLCNWLSRDGGGRAASPAIVHPPTDRWAAPLGRRSLCSSATLRTISGGHGWELKEVSSVALALSSQPAQAKAFLSQCSNTSRKSNAIPRAPLFLPPHGPGTAHPSSHNNLPDLYLARTLMGPCTWHAHLPSNSTKQVMS